MTDCKITDVMPLAFAYHKMLFDAAQQPADFEFLDMNQAYEELTGLKKPAVIGKTLLQVVSDLRKTEFDWIAKCGEMALAGGRHEFVQYSETLKRWFKIFIVSTEPKYFYVFLADVTQNIIERQEKEIILETLNELVFVVDEDFVYTQVFTSDDSKLFVPRQEIVGSKISDLFPPEFSGLMISALKRAKDTGEKTLLEYQSPVPGDQTWYEAENIYRETSIGNLYIIKISNITERKNKDAELVFAYLHDPLTGLLNRNALRILNHEPDNHRKLEDGSSAICVNIDNFRLVNEALGNQSGDQIIIALSQKIKDCVADRGSVYRYEGDEFVVITESIDIAAVKQLAREIQNSVSEQIRINNRIYFLTASIGLCIGSPGKSIEKTVKSADTALYIAKKKKNSIRVYSKDMENARSRDIILEEDLRCALEKGQLEVYYQPVFDVRKGVINQAEALLRWNHPEFGQISPLEFIPIAERTKLILPMTDWVIEQVCGKISAWNALGIHSMMVSVNLSYASFENRGKELTRFIQDVIRKTDIQPADLKLEITESTLMYDVDEMIQVVQELKTIGVKLALDDFGTGYSSFGYMKDLPLDIIKLDRSLVSNIITDEREQMILASLVTIIHGLALDIVVEGVETREQLEFLKKYECDYIQGFVFSRPLPADEFEQYYLLMNARDNSEFINPDHVPTAEIRMEWRDEWMSGNSEIDRQHQTLMRLGNRLIHDALDGLDKTVLLDQFDLLLHDITLHFEEEEEYLKEIGYPAVDLANHTDEHKGLIEKALALRTAYVHDEIKASSFFTFVMDDVILNHMIDEDKKYFPYIDERTRTEADIEQGKSIADA